MTTQFTGPIINSTHSLPTTQAQNQLYRLGGYSAIAGAIAFLLGAIIWGTTGTDLDLAVVNGEMADFLIAAGAHRTALILNLSLWILGVLLLGVAGSAIARLGDRPVPTHLAQACYRTAPPLVVVAYVAMLAVLVQLAPDTSAASVASAELLGWLGSRADWIGTILIIGAGPVFLASAGQDSWIPTWLLRFSYANAVCGLLTAVALFTNSLGSYGFIIIPVGLVWMLCAGVVLLRQAGNQR